MSSGNCLKPFLLYSIFANYFSGNHAGYRQLKGTRASAQEIGDIYEGLCQSYLTDFDVLLSGYAPSAAAVEAVGKIAVDIQKKTESKPGSFFWGMLYYASFLRLAYSRANRSLPDQSSTLSWVIRVGSMSTRTLYLHIRKLCTMRICYCQTNLKPSKHNP